jgi:predicted CoA-binding protein
MKKTAIIGASTNPTRYAYLAAQMLNNHHIEFVPLGIRPGEVFGKKILDIRESPELKDIHTVTMYLGPQNQPPYYDYLLGLKPKRIIFNPGTENDEFRQMAEDQGIETEEACTLVMLRLGAF